MWIMYHNNHHYHWLWSSGQVGVQWNCIRLYHIPRPKPLATGRNSHGRGRSQPQPVGYHGVGAGGGA